MKPLIYAFLNDWIQVEKFVRYADGEPIFEPPETRRCRIEIGTNYLKTRANVSGEIESHPVNARVFCIGDKIPIDSRVTYHEKSYVVVECKVCNGFSFDHLEVMLK